MRCLSALRQYIISFVNDALIIAENFQLILKDGDRNNVKGIVNYASTESEMTGYLYELDNSDFTVATFFYDNAGLNKYILFLIPQFLTFNRDESCYNRLANATTLNQSFQLKRCDNTIGIAFQATSTFATDFANATFKLCMISWTAKILLINWMLLNL